MSTEQNVLIEPGSIKIDNAVIINSEGAGVNVKRLVVSVEIYEDIFSAFITGKIVLSDAIDLSSILPLKGEELLILELTTPGFDEEIFKRRVVFSLYKLENSVNAALRNVVHVISFMSLDAAMDMNKKVSKTFRGRVSDTVKLILEDERYLASNKELLIEPTQNEFIHTSNFWTPSKNLFYLAEHSLNDLGNPSYLFFEQAEGFMFASLDKLYGMTPVNTFIRDQQTRESTGEERNFDAEYGKVLELAKPNLYDYVDRLTSGLYGSTHYFFDVEAKKIHYNTKESYKEYTKNRARLNEHFPVDPNAEKFPFRPDANIMVDVQQRNSYNGSPVLPIEMNQKRAAILNQARFNTVSIQVFGRFDYTVGRTADLVVYADKQHTADNADPSDIYDKILTGRYLITSLCHVITQEKHVCNMELSKDTYTFKI